MSTGFIYVIPTVGKDYLQPSLQCVPTFFEGSIYFGPCKKPMRPKMKPGDYVFGMSPSGTFPRRVVFAAKIAEKMTFGEAYERFLGLRGPVGPIHVRPARMPAGRFPDSLYEHIPGANHAENWRSDIQTPKLDAFFVCEPETTCLGRWMGVAGSAVNGEIVEFLKTCEVHGNAGLLSTINVSATAEAPVRHGRLYTGLHLETREPEQFLDRVCRGVRPDNLASSSLVESPALPMASTSTSALRRKC